MNRIRVVSHRIGVAASIVAVTAALAGCATGYGPAGLTGGYSEKQITPRMYYLTYAGNGHTSQAQVFHGWLYRASQLTEAAGYASFAMVSSRPPGIFYPKAPADRQAPPTVVKPSSMDTPAPAPATGAAVLEPVAGHTVAVPVVIPGGGGGVMTYSIHATFAMYKERVPKDATTFAWNVDDIQTALAAEEHRSPPELTPASKDLVWPADEASAFAKAAQTRGMRMDDVVQLIAAPDALKATATDAPRPMLASATGAPTLDAQTLFARLAPSVWVVKAQGMFGQSQGSAVVVAPGRLVTNCHVLAYGSSIMVSHGSTSLAATLQFPDVHHDLCELAVEGLNAPAVNLARSANVRVGEKILTIGAPRGFELTLGEGLVSSVRVVDGRNLLQISAPLSHGSSGGGVFDEHGDLVGIASYTVEGAEEINFAWPSELLLDLPSSAAEAYRAYLS